MRATCLLVIGLTAFAFVLPAAGLAEPRVSAMPQQGLRLIDGQQLFRGYCAPCHGQDARGAGSVASTLKTPPPDLTTLAQRSGGEFPRARLLRYIAEGDALTAHGSKEMPVWGPNLTALGGASRAPNEQIEQILDFLHSVQRNMPLSAQQADSAAARGKDTYQNHCAVCHGDKGNGKGPAADALRPRPTDLTRMGQRAGTFPAERVSGVLNGTGTVTAHGSVGMMMWGPFFLADANGDRAKANARIADVVAYISSIQTK